MDLPLNSQLYLFNLAQQVEGHRQVLITRCLDSLRACIFTNRPEFHPRRLPLIVEREVDVLLRYIKGEIPTGREHGIELCRSGLSKDSLFGLLNINREFFTTYMVGDLSAMLIAAQYRADVLEGFYEAKEAIILSEQDTIRHAFQTALSESFEQTHAAQTKVQSAIETGYHNVILALEDERRRISRELHDQAGQALIGVRLSLQNLLVDDLSDSKQKMDRIRRTIDSVDGIIRDIRDLAYKLRPPILDLLGIDMALKQLCYDFSDQTGLIIEYIGTELANYGDEVGISIYRFVQEALTNIAKHANATHVWVILGQSGTRISLAVCDNGQGFDPKKVKYGVGLSGMYERIRLLKGSLEIFQDQRANTVINFSIPFASNNS